MRKSALFCIQIADAELWDDLIRMAKEIVEKQRDPKEALSSDFICKSWTLKQTQLSDEDWHQIPHTGAIFKSA